MIDEDGPTIRIHSNEIEPWIMDALNEYGPSDLVLDETAAINLKITRLRGKCKKYAMTMLFHCDYQDEVFFVVLDWNRRTKNLKCNLADWRAELEKFAPVSDDPAS